MLCKKCGAQIDDNAKECKFCGQKFVDNAEVVEETIEQEAPQEVEESPEADTRSTHEIFEENERRRREQKEEEVVDEKEQQLSEISERREQKKRKERRKKIALVVILCLLVAAIAGGGAFYLKYHINKGGNVIKTTPTPTPTQSTIPTPNPSYSPTPTPSGSPEATASQTPAQPMPTGPVRVTTTTTPITQATSAPQRTAAPAAPAATATAKPAAENTTAAPQGTAKPAATPQPTAKPATIVASRKGTNADGYKVPQKQSGVVNGTIVSRLVVGGQVIDDGTTKLPVMTFNMDGTTYYAYVSKGSWTGAINGKYMTVTATATGEKYKGNTIYDISRLVYYTADDYIIADSGVRELSAAELQNYSKEQLALARNEIFARHGRKFDTKEYNDHFATKSWYKVSEKYNYSDERTNINSIEKKNVDTILAVELTK